MSITHSQQAPRARGLADRVNGLARRLVLGKLSELQGGRLRVLERDQVMHFGSADPGAELAATVRVYDPRFYRLVAFGGSVGAGESYIQGDWDCDDVTALVRLFVCNREHTDTVDSGLGRLCGPLYRLAHWLNRNTPAGSRRNIAAHYDLGNDLFEHFLDESMMYSCAVFERPDMDLYDASVAKLDIICRKLELGESDHVLEIGTGWGGFALHAAGRYGCRVTTTTISRSQYDYARERVRQAGLEDKVSILLRDYRDLEGRYDKLVSIEMIEAIGHQYYPLFFAKCSQLLKDDGMMLLQAITMADQHYDYSRRRVDFIKRFVFPGGCLPSVTAMTSVLSRHTDMRVFHLEDIGAHYAETLRHWRERFHHNLEAIRGLGYSEEFRRLWEFYLHYCEGAFRERAIGDVQLLLIKPGCRRAPLGAPVAARPA